MSKAQKFNTKSDKADAHIVALEKRDVIDTIVRILDTHPTLYASDLTNVRGMESRFLRVKKAPSSLKALSRQEKALLGDKKASPLLITDLFAKLVNPAMENLSHFAEDVPPQSSPLNARGDFKLHTADLKSAIKRIEHRDNEPFAYDKIFHGSNDLVKTAQVMAMISSGKAEREVTFRDAADALCKHFSPEKVKELIFRHMNCPLDPSDAPASHFITDNRLLAGRTSYSKAPGQIVEFLCNFTPLIIKRLQRYEYLKNRQENRTQKWPAPKQ